MGEAPGRRAGGESSGGPLARGSRTRILAAPPSLLADQYFSVLVKSGQLVPTWLGGAPPWESKYLFYCVEEIVDKTLETVGGDRKVTTPEEWQAVVQESERDESTLRVWVREGLEDLVKALLEG